MKKLTTKTLIISIGLIAVFTNAIAQRPGNNNNGYREMDKRDSYNTDRHYNDCGSNFYSSPMAGYYYYPDADIYFSASEKRYIYNNGQEWLTVSMLPFRISLDLMPKVFIATNNPKIWLYNYKHRKQFCHYPNRFNGPPIGYRDRNDWNRWHHR